MDKQETLPPRLESRALHLVTLASKSVYTVKGKDDMAFIALIKAGVKTCNSDSNKIVFRLLWCREGYGSDYARDYKQSKRKGLLQPFPVEAANITL